MLFGRMDLLCHQTSLGLCRCVSNIPTLTGFQHLATTCPRGHVMDLDRLPSRPTRRSKGTPVRAVLAMLGAFGGACHKSSAPRE